MTPIADSAWRPSVELAVVAQPIPVEPPEAPAGAEEEGFKLFGDDGFTFLDFLDIINPLHHIPVIGTLYRHFTDDEIDPGSRVFGSTLFFGPVGTVASIGDVLIRDATGKDVGQHVMALFDDNADGPARATEVAEATPSVVADVNTPSSHAVAAAETPEPLDPITAWAMEEVAYRESLAARTHAATDAESGGRGRVAAPMPAVAAAYAASRQALVAAGLAEPAKASELPARRTTDAAAARAMIRDTRGSAAMYAATYGTADRAQPRQRETDAAATPPGAIAPLGGWFSDAMLKVNDKYRAGAADTGRRLPTTIDVTR